MAEHEAKRLKTDVKRIGTHNGHFHADEALAVYMLRMTDAFRGAKVVRSRDPKILEECDIIVDVQGQYDGTKHFDHHQRSFSETFSPSFKTKLSSAGLIYKHYAKELISSALSTACSSSPTASSTSGPSPQICYATTTGTILPDHPSVSKLYTKLYEDFVEALDAHDNGIPAYPADIPAAYKTSGITLPAQVAALNPWWNVPSNSADEDERFERASELMGSNFKSKLEYLSQAWLPARDTVVRALDDALDYDPDCRIVVFPDTFVPWKEHLFELEAERKIVGRSWYVVYCDGRGTAKENWRIQCVPTTPDGFENRKGLPEAWRGVRDEQLSEVTGIPGGVFVHASGFIGGNKTYEGVMDMARKAVAA